MNGNAMMKWIGWVTLATILVGCFGPQRRSVEVAFHQLAIAPQSTAVVSTSVSVGVRKVEVRAATWLATTDMQYRFVNAEPTRRRSYADSRWVAVPAEMIELAMNRQLLGGTTPVSSECRLRVDLDEFIQEFDDPQTSRVVIDARMNLLGARGEISLAQHRVQKSQVTRAGDAASGVVGLSAVTTELVGEAANWLGRLKTDAPSVLARCR